MAFILWEILRRCGVNREPAATGSPHLPDQ